MINIIGNIGVFVPFGILLPLVSNKRMSGIYPQLGMAFVSILSIELMQIIFQVGQFDVDDIFLNMIGFALGLWILRVCRNMAKTRLLI